MRTHDLLTDSIAVPVRVPDTDGLEELSSREVLQLIAGYGRSELAHFDFFFHLSISQLSP